MTEGGDMVKTFHIFLRILCLCVVLAAANCWADEIVLTPDYCPGINAGCRITDLTDSGMVLGQAYGGRLDYNPLLFWLPSDGYVMHTFDAPWSDLGTIGLDIDNAGDILFKGLFSNSDPRAWGSLTGYGILDTQNDTWVPDSTGTMVADWGPIDTQLTNASGQFIATVPLPESELKSDYPATVDYVLVDPVPEPSSLLLLGTLAVPALIRLRKRR